MSRTVGAMENKWWLGLVLSACVGPTGMDGIDGMDGVDGSSCIVTSDDDGAHIVCPDGSEATVPPGGSCGVVADALGVGIACDDGSSVTLPAAEIGWTCDSPEVRVGNLAELTLLGALGCSELAGDLVIEGLLGVDALPSLAFTAVHGSLVIARNYDLLALTGLASLVAIDGDLLIVDNLRLTDLSGLDQLTTIGGALELSGNAAIEELAAPPGLAEIDSIRITDNTVLTTIYDLVAEVHDLAIIGNPALANVYARDLETISGELVVSNNPRLPGLSFTRLTHVGADAIISGNEALLYIDAPVLERIEGNLALTRASFRDLWSLRHLATVGGTLSVGDNPSLASCELAWWLERVEVGDRVYQWSNAELETCCSGSPQLERVTPRTGGPGQLTTVYGSELGGCGPISAEIGGIAAEVTAASPGHVEVRVPAGLETGHQSFVVTTDRGTASYDGFHVVR